MKGRLSKTYEESPRFSPTRISKVISQAVEQVWGRFYLLNLFYIIRISEKFPQRSLPLKRHSGYVGFKNCLIKVRLIKSSFFFHFYNYD